MPYVPFNYEQINLAAGTYNPSPVKSYNNKSFAFWERSLFQRACSTLQFDLPDEWQGSAKDFFLYCLFKYGFVSVFDNDKFGLTFQPCTINGINWYYQPTNVLVSNPALSQSLNLKIGTDCELLKLTPDYQGTWDVISYYAAKLSTLDNAIDMSLINNKYGMILGARSKSSAEGLKKALDKINRGEPAVVIDQKLINDPKDPFDPFVLLERDLHKTYLTTEQLDNFQTLIKNFDAEIGIPTLANEKKERMITDEAQTKVIDGMSRSIVWFETLTSSLEKCKELYPQLDLNVKLRYEQTESGEEVQDNE